MTAPLSGRQPKAVRSALAVLEEVVAAGPGVTAKEISAALRLPPATTYRLLNLLVADEYLVRLPDLKGFALGRRAARLALPAAPAVPTAVWGSMWSIWGAPSGVRRAASASSVLRRRPGRLKIARAIPRRRTSNWRRASASSSAARTLTAAMT